MIIHKGPWPSPPVFRSVRLDKEASTRWKDPPEKTQGITRVRTDDHHGDSREREKFKILLKSVSWNVLYSAGALTRLLSDFLLSGQLPQSREKRQLATIH